MNEKILDRANAIKTKIDRKRSELRAFRRATELMNGYISIIPDMYNPDRAIHSSTLLDYMCRDDVKKEIEKILEKEISDLEKEFEEL